MRRWQLLEQLAGDTYLAVDGAETDADTWGRAVEHLLPAAICASQRITDSLTLDTMLGQHPPERMTIRTLHGNYRVVPINLDFEDDEAVRRIEQILGPDVAVMLARIDQEHLR